MAKFDESKHPRDKEGKFTFKGGYRQNTGYGEILENDRRRESDKPDYLADEYIGKSVGAKAANYDILMPDGSIVHLAEGTYITNKEVIAGRGKPSTHIREIDRLVQEYGGDPKKWSKVKGIGTLDVEGEYLRAELHWYEEPHIGKVDFKLKRQKSGEWFL